jgi:hypothetical protein
MTIEAATPGSQVLLLSTVPPPNLKGIISTDSSLTVNGLTFEGAAIPNSDGGNAAAIRDQSTSATSLIVENSTFLNNQEGILTGGSNYQETVQILNSRFINNGNSTDPNGQEHALYVGDAGSLGVSNSLFCGTLLGHDIKSRALSTTVQNSTMYIGAAASPGSPDYDAGCTMPGVDQHRGRYTQRWERSPGRRCVDPGTGEPERRVGVLRGGRPALRRRQHLRDLG